MYFILGKVILVTNFNSFTAFLMQEHNRNKTSKELFQTIKENGYSGKYNIFCDRINNLYASNRIIKTGIGLKIEQRHTWSPNKLSFLLYSDKEKLSIVNKSFMDLLFYTCPEIKQIEVLVKQFKDLFKKRKQDRCQNGLLMQK